MGDLTNRESRRASQLAWRHHCSSSAAQPASSTSQGVPRLDHYLGASGISAALDDGDVVLLRALWLIKHSRKPGAILPRRQDLPEEAFFSTQEVVSEAKIKRKIMAVSYVWGSTEHPDPDGRLLQVVARLAHLFVLEAGDIAIFLDWCSLYQAPRSAEEAASFARASLHMCALYAHERVVKLLLTSLRPPLGASPASTRGWVAFEDAACRLLSPAASVLDIGRIGGEDCNDTMVSLNDNTVSYVRIVERCQVERRPPLVPDALLSIMRIREFTHEADRAALDRKYRDAFIAWASDTKELRLCSLGWGDQEASDLAAAIRFCPQLFRLDLRGNRVCQEGAAKLAAAIPRCRGLVELHLAGNRLMPQDEYRISQAWRHAKKPDSGLVFGAGRMASSAPSVADQIGVEEDDDTSNDMEPFYYEGSFRKDRRCGEGVLTIPGIGFKYVGQFRNDVFDGEGVATNADGSSYKGQWKEGRKVGQGEHVSSDGLKYTGSWLENNRHGQGSQEYVDGGRYHGNWYNGICNGRGRYFFPDGSRYEGAWTNGRYSGPGVLYQTDGTKERLTYHGGVLVKREVLDDDAAQNSPASKAFWRRPPPLYAQDRNQVHKPIRLPALPPMKSVTKSIEAEGIDLAVPSLRPATALRRLAARKAEGRVVLTAR
eukprot:TRINITY_DN40744_c0_g1_i1.p1 TRINITY_DN40744_c0_g1~~TRINITY_DN40744_c0_g1_i1.p1  ORF type:complete len:656 (-),score=115.62 TRINITY_DN40744_c0_g1_i1:288-2255(-)